MNYQEGSTLTRPVEKPFPHMNAEGGLSRVPKTISLGPNTIFFENSSFQKNTIGSLPCGHLGWRHNTPAGPYAI